jgi:hypothetical protein
MPHEDKPSILGSMPNWLRRIAPSSSGENEGGVNEGGESDSVASEASRRGVSKSGHGHIKVSFAELQRMRLRKLQIKLVYHAVKMHSSGEESKDWEETLQQYSTCHAMPKTSKLYLASNREHVVQALRDYDYIDTCLQRVKDPFIATSARKVDGLVLQNALRVANEPMDFLFPEPIEKSNEPISGTRRASFEKARLKAFVVRIALAIVGGGLLIGPMWLMVLHNTHYTALISTSVLVLIFGVIMAWVIDDLMNVVSATAAYAAVLVVFVGANTT